MALKPFESVFAPLIFPIGGKEYVVPPRSIEDGATLTSILNGDAPEMPDDELGRLLLGPIYDEMTADGVPHAARTRAVAAVLADFQTDRTTAEIVWETGGDPFAIPAALEARQSTPSGEATSTKRPASTSGTKSSRKA